MAKTSKIVPQKEAASSSRLAGNGAAAEPHPEEFVPAGCPTVADFKIEKTSSSPKDVAMRPPSGNEDVPLESPAPRFDKGLNKSGSSRQLQAQIDAIQIEAEEFKKNMDLITSQKESVQTQLALAEAQLRDAKEKTSVQAKRIEELQSKRNSAVSSQESLATKLEAAKSKVAIASTKADAKVAQFKVDIEAIQAQAKSMVDHARWEARREALEGVHAQGFDILAEIENAKVEEARARKLAFPEEDSESLTESEGREDPEDEEASPEEDQAA
ncbi:uncharacterized protein [Nicotiana tomentosiformis]|uniref:uncharacterized protein n=1 Tax=Nicotiana tomentosiformis TaxID=4098 RepID=UPI00388CAEFD